MLLGALLAAVGGLAAGVLINYIADVAPPEPDEEVTPAERRPLGIFPLLAPSDYTFPATAAYWRYLAIELGAMLTAAVLWLILDRPPSIKILTIVYVEFFLLVALIDVEHRLVLDVVMVPAFIVAIAELVISGRRPAGDWLSGFALAQIVVMGFYLMGRVYLWAVNASRPEDQQINTVAFGFGDVTLATFCGMIVGFQGALLMLFYMLIIGALSAALFMVANRLLGGAGGRHSAIPYGPSIVLAATLVLVFGNNAIWFLLRL